jgi:hypothetical protein
MIDRLLFDIKWTVFQLYSWQQVKQTVNHVDYKSGTEMELWEEVKIGTRKQGYYGSDRKTRPYNEPQTATLNNLLPVRS